MVNKSYQNIGIAGLLFIIGLFASSKSNATAYTDHTVETLEKYTPLSDTDSIPVPEASQVGSHLLDEIEALPYAVARAYEDSIYIRWYPESYYYWSNGLSFGYNVKKYLQNSNVLIEEFIVNPWDSSQFMQHINSTNDTIFYLAASILYGEEDPEEDPLMYENQKRDLYGFTLIKGFQYPKMMESIGLQFTDRKVKKGESYRYEISRIGENISMNEKSFEVTVLNEFIPVGEVKNVKVDSNQFSLDVLIDKDANKEEFVMYNISKSSSKDNQYIPVTAEPIFFSEDSTENNILDYNVFLGVNYQTYFLKVEGMNMFGEFSPPFYLEGYGVDTIPPPAPYITFPELVDTNKVRVSWETIVEPDDFAGYQVELGNKPFGEFKSISGLLPSSTAIYYYTADSFPNELLYFQVSAYDIHGNKGSSIAMLLNIRDTIPPLAPSNLSGQIDDDGIVEITWDEAIEDLNGYRVYFANDSTVEFSQLTGSTLLMENLFRDTIALNMLADEIYYIVEAEDKSYNRSYYSKILTLKRPDILPPVAPVLLPTESDGNGVSLHWHASTSYDVVMHYIFRKIDNESEDNWIALDSVPFFGEHYVDTTAEIEKIYRYKIQAKDDVGLVSDFSLGLVGRRYFDGQAEVVSNLTGVRDTDNFTNVLTWEPTTETDQFLSNLDYRYVIFRGTSSADLMRLTQLTDKTPQYVDDDIEENQSYIYSIQLLYEDGKKSNLSDSITISAN